MVESDENGKRLWTAGDVARYLGWHPQTVYRKAREGVLPHLKIGSALRFRPSDIEQWADAQAA